MPLLVPYTHSLAMFTLPTSMTTEVLCFLALFQDASQLLHHPMAFKDTHGQVNMHQTLAKIPSGGYFADIGNISRISAFKMIP